MGKPVAPDDLNAPLGQSKTRKRTLPALLPQALAAVLGVFIIVFVLWAAIANDPLGGEPATVVSMVPEQKKFETPNPTPAAAPAAPAAAEAKTPPPPAGTQTVTIIDGSSGKRQEVLVPAPAESKRAPVDPRFLETSRHGPIPKISPDGARPAEVYARAAKAVPGEADGPRVAIIIGGLGVGAIGTSEALGKLPGPITFAFTPYGGDLENLVSRARAGGHEVLLQVPMEPFDYPDNDPGPQTLLSSLSGEQNVDRLHWQLSRFQGYVGISNFMGARFTASEAALAPVLRETAKRGLIYVDDGSSPRSLASQIAGANKLAFARSEVVIDVVSTPGEIDKALSKLENIARERGTAVGFGSALPVTIDRVAKWAKTLQARGIVLVPISVVALKSKRLSGSDLA